ncbi:MAG: acetyl-CoA carboxylase biotin carboxyl carrier protein [Polyangiaceae bacterium]
MKVDFEQLGKLLTLLREESVAEFEHESDGLRMRIVRGGRAVPAVSFEHAPVAAAPAPRAEASAAALPADVVEVTSPFVGTFYGAPSPELPPFVSVGAQVKAGQTLCIIEAMKLMNEIESEVAGTITEILVKNGQSVEFGQKLFRVKKG